MTFDIVKEQIKNKEEGVCEAYDANTQTKDANRIVDYKLAPEVTTYVVDYSSEYATILQKNKETNVFVEQDILEANKTTQVSALNGSVVAKVNGTTIQKLEYSDYGVNSKQEVGFTYNGEQQEETGYIYLRARYYDPTIGSFIQIDKNYQGEQNDVTSQNRYTYTINNPYKYVDRDGNKVEDFSKLTYPGQIHSVVQNLYASRYGYGREVTVGTLLGAIKEPIIDVGNNTDYIKRIDLYSLATRNIWEIKSGYGSGNVELGATQLADYVRALKNKFSQGGPVPEFKEEEVPITLNTGESGIATISTYNTMSLGVIIYFFDIEGGERLPTSEVPQNVPVPIGEYSLQDEYEEKRRPDVVCEPKYAFSLGGFVAAGIDMFSEIFKFLNDNRSPISGILAIAFMAIIIAKFGPAALPLIPMLFPRFMPG